MEPREKVEAALRDGLSAGLEEALRPLRVPSGPLGILFSGGVDSSLLAWELRHRPELSLWTLGREGSSDLLSGRAGAERLGLPWRAVPMAEAVLRAAEARFEEELSDTPFVSRTVLLALAMAIQGAGPSRLVCGQGVDELFLGYAHYRDLSSEEAERRSRDDLLRLHEHDWPRTQQIAAKLRKTIVAPYLSPGFEESAGRVPIELRLPRAVPKRFFREWAVDRGLPLELAYRPKKALQYGSGVAAAVRALRRSDR